MKLQVLLIGLITTGVILCPSMTRAVSPTAPEGFRAIFNGDNLDGWYGLNPHSAARLTGEKRAANLQQQREEFAAHWRAVDGELINDGHGPYATTEEEFGDIEFLIEYKTVAKADSGIYLRGTPQVQIWDWQQAFDPKRPTRKPHLGSGGLFNNTPGAPGRDPMRMADKPFGQWNQFRIRQIGDRTWVWLNGKLVVDNAVMENFWDREKPLPAKGPIMLQTHGGEIRWRNLFVREIDSDEASRLLAEASQPQSDLMSALTLHASFDNQLDADFSRGDRTAYLRLGKEFARAAVSDEVQLSKHDGRFGGSLHFTKKSNQRPLFTNPGVLDYNDTDWSATVSLWLRLDPDQDLEPGYCDPAQIIGDNNKQGFIFLEFSKDESPRLFRYAVRPLIEIWNPDNAAWDEIPAAKRPMVQVEKTPFSRDAWTHVAFTLENINHQQKPSTARLFLNGKPQGAIEGWDLTLGWDPADVLLLLGASYVGHMDDLGVFNRALSDREIQQVYQLERGLSELHASVPNSPASN